MLSKNKEISHVESTNELNENLDVVCKCLEGQTLRHPWRRFFARTLDITFYTLIWQVFTRLVLNWNIEKGIFITVINTYFPLLIMLILEPLLLSKYGTTLGKLVFGLVVRNLDDEKLTYQQGWHRTFGVFRKGIGYNIPLYNILLMINCYDDCKAQKVLPWEKNLSYNIKDKKIIRIIVCIAIFILIGGISVLVSMQAEMPLHRGDITPEQYYENCNDIMSQSNRDYGRHLNIKGEWIENRTQTDMFSAEIQPLPKHQLTVKDGIVTGISIELETDNDFLTFGYWDQRYVIVKSFLLAQSDMNYISFMNSGILESLSNKCGNYTFTEAGVKVINKVELRGYEVEDDWIISTEGEKYIHLVFTMEKL